MRLQKAESELYDAHEHLPHENLTVAKIASMPCCRIVKQGDSAPHGCSRADVVMGSPLQITCMTGHD